MRNLIVLLAEALVIIILFFLQYTVKRLASRVSDVVAIYSYITRPKGYTINPADSCFYLIDTDFRSFKTNVGNRSDETRLFYIKDVLRKESRLFENNKLSDLELGCFVTPNNSKEIQKLKYYADKKWKQKTNLFLLTISSPCVFKEGNYYYVERIFKMDNKGSAEIFFLKNGAIQMVIPVWTN